jgi:hypothetical protein
VSVPWRRALVTVGYGAALGALILGIGGRIAMRVVATSTTGTSGFSLGGTLTVVFLGAASGAVAGVILSITRALLWRWPAARAIAFWLVLVAITLRGLRPLDPLRVALFVPLVLLLGVLLSVLTRHPDTART